MTQESSLRSSAAVVMAAFALAVFISVPARAAKECRNPKPPKPVNRVAPEYTTEAKERRFEGTILLRAIIDEKGVVEEIEVVRPLPYGLNQTAMDALRVWKFKPGTCDGKPAKVLWDISLTFKLEN